MGVRVPPFAPLLLVPTANITIYLDVIPHRREAAVRNLLCEIADPSARFACSRAGSGRALLRQRGKSCCTLIAAAQRPTCRNSPFALRQTLTTAIVQNGTRSTPGTSLAKNDGRNSQCQPSR